MSERQADVDGTPTWALLQLLRFIVLLPVGTLFVAVMASPALAAIWTYAPDYFWAAGVTVLWLGAIVGSEMDAESVADNADVVDVDTPRQMLVALVALSLASVGMTSMHVVGVTTASWLLIQVGVPTSLIVMLPLILSATDLLMARLTGVSLLAVGFWIAYGILKLVESAIGGGPGSVADAGAPAGRIANV